MHKRTLHHIWKRLQFVRIWLLIILLAASAGLFVYNYRKNNLEMLKLRQAVFAADEQGGDIEGALHKLREYVHAHMNTSLSTQNSVKPPIQLKYRYERLAKAELDRVAAANAKIYTDAQADCERRFPAGLSGGSRVPCIEEYVTTHGTKAQVIPDALYKFDFVSPRWSPDTAGWSLLVTIFLAIVLMLRLGLDRLLKHQLHTHL
jgi:hypothetical protein